ncbi:MBL fold metallo-hydrolase [Herbidospora sp. NEAU-GS84]|uniref:MBL fold metallo-hydrolase n=1 Tax=Herbidospora solisilvae TaxID=2696284 RepID=A0A7C9NPY9_9ACTN|nr:alkyl sulfatase dimerization domain-containing protein [Herbidospora solisilvae]NAS24216.1 MBL fold metallo-hydrolase [Herbidospora solisilvae]
MADLPFHDQTDFADADRGFAARLDPALIRSADGRIVWNADAYRFLDHDTPGSADPSLWRQSRLCARQGLYEVTDGVWQVRGLDLSNMTLIEGERGVIVVDPLLSTECAVAALALYRGYRGPRPVTGVIYTHSHADHYGGVRGVTDGAGIPIIAPAGFLEHAVAENVYAGTAMVRRGVYMYGLALPISPEGQIGCGLGLTASQGTVSLLPPTVDVTTTGQLETVDGVRIVFQLTPGTEAPAEMNFLLPERHALCLAENATHTQHNLGTLRGAQVRDARSWSRYLNQVLDLFVPHAEVAFASHHWPTWGRERITKFVQDQRDLYAYLHDQTLRLINQGLTAAEIAERIELPPGLETAWNTRGYYGSASHNVKAIYQRYLGWFDGNPAHLWEHPPVEQSRRYVECLGGPSATVAMATRYIQDGDLRFAATLLNHAVFASPGHAEARRRLTEVYTRLGQSAENGVWRNFYLTAALELTARRTFPAGADTAAPDVLTALTLDQLLDAVAVRVNGPKAWNESLSIDWNLTDTGELRRTTLSNGALIIGPGGPADLSLRLTKPEFLAVLNGQEPGDHEGDLGVLTRLLNLLDDPDPGFAIVTPG